MKRLCSCISRDRTGRLKVKAFLFWAASRCADQTWPQPSWCCYTNFNFEVEMILFCVVLIWHMYWLATGAYCKYLIRLHFPATLWTSITASMGASFFRPAGYAISVSNHMAFCYEDSQIFGTRSKSARVFGKICMVNQSEKNGAYTPFISENGLRSKVDWASRKREIWSELMHN